MSSKLETRATHRRRQMHERIGRRGRLKKMLSGAADAIAKPLTLAQAVAALRKTKKA